MNQISWFGSKGGSWDRRTSCARCFVNVMHKSWLLIEQRIIRRIVAKKHKISAMSHTEMRPGNCSGCAVEKAKPKRISLTLFLLSFQCGYGTWGGIEPLQICFRVGPRVWPFVALKKIFSRWLRITKWKLVNRTGLICLIPNKWSNGESGALSSFPTATGAANAYKDGDSALCINLGTSSRC